MERQMLKVYHEILVGETKTEVVLDLKGFNLQESVIKSRLIRYIIKRLFDGKLGLEKVHIDDIIALCSNNVGNKFLIPNKNVKVLVKNHRIYFYNLLI